MEKALPAGSIKIEKLELLNYKKDVPPLNILSLVQEFNIYESLHKSFITANFVISDALALTTQFPIVGQELIRIKFKTPHPGFLKDVDLILHVVGISTFKTTNLRSGFYVLKCCSPEMVKNWNTKIRKAYREITINEMAKLLFDEFLKTKVQFNDDSQEFEMLEVSETEGPRTIVIPNMHPSKAMNLLQREAKSVEYPASNFNFYQNSDGFYFKTLEEMIDPNVRTSRFDGKSLDKYFATEMDLRKGSSPIENATIGEGGRTGGGSQQSAKPYEFLKILDFSFDTMFDYEKTLKMGGLENTSRFIDPITSLYQETKFDYLQDIDLLKKTSEERPFPFLTQEQEYTSQGLSRIQYFMTNFQQTNDYSPEQKHEMLHVKTASFALLNNIIVNISIPGNSEARIGDVLNLAFPEFGAQDEVIGKLNKFISGEYLIISLRHMYNGASYSTFLTCLKNCYEGRIE